MKTARDAEIVAWIGSLGAAGTVHVMERFQMSQGAAYARLRALVRERQLSFHQLLHGHPGLYTATRAGLRWRGLERLAMCRVGAGGFEHAWELASAATRLEAELAGWEILGERMLRLREHDEGRLLGSAVIGRLPRGGPAVHRPDLLLAGPAGRAIAVEVELTVKAPVRLAAICRGYARARHLERVFYLARAPAGRALARAIHETRAGERIAILELHEEQAIAQRLRAGAARV